MGLLDSIAAKGRGGDTRLAHLTNGEVVVPREVAALRPDLIAHIGEQIKAMGGNPNGIVVGRGRVNPKTGIEEFATEAEVKDAYQRYLGRDPDPEGLSYWTNSWNQDAFLSAASASENFKDRAVATSQPAVTPTTPQPAVTPTTPQTDYTNQVTNWYRNVVGRDAEAEGLNYWTSQLGNGKSADDVFKEFNWAVSNLTGKTYDKTVSDASSPYTGWRSSDGKNVGDEWVRNVMGREATAYDRQQDWYKALSADGGGHAMTNDLYDQFLDWAAQNGGIKNVGLDKFQASLLKPLQKEKVPQDNQQYKPIFDSAVDAGVETIEGRIERLLAANNPVIRQAGDRARQAFADRGLLNSSMAEQAAYEAMVSKAIEIAGPDAERYFSNRRQNVDWTNKFATNEQLFNYDIAKLEKSAELNKEMADYNNDLNAQTNYQQAVSNIQQQYSQQLAAIQGSQMEAEDKQFAVDNLVVTRDNSIRLMTATFQMFPGWRDEWSKLVSLLPTG